MKNDILSANLQFLHDSLYGSLHDNVRALLRATLGVLNVPGFGQGTAEIANLARSLEQERERLAKQLAPNRLETLDEAVMALRQRAVVPDQFGQFSLGLDAFANAIRAGDEERVQALRQDLLSQVQSLVDQGPRVILGSNDDGTPYFGTMSRALTEAADNALDEARLGDQARAELKALKRQPPR